MINKKIEEDVKLMLEYNDTCINAGILAEAQHKQHDKAIFIIPSLKKERGWVRINQEIYTAVLESIETIILNHKLTLEKKI